MKSKRCFSKCRKLTREECSNKPTFCQFTRGQRNYCRLRNSYLLDKNCNITKKTPKNKNAKNTKKNASTKIKGFMIKTGDKRRAVFLRTICADSGVCVAFGTEINKINKFFDNFQILNTSFLLREQSGRSPIMGLLRKLNTKEKDTTPMPY